MNTKPIYQLLVFLTVIAFAISACGAKFQSPVVFPTATRGASAAAPMTTDATPEPAAGASGECITWATFETLVNQDPYVMIDALNARPEKVDHPVGGFQLLATASQTQIFWTGRYDVSDITSGGRTIPLRVDGHTGVYALKSGQSTWVGSPSGSLCVTGATLEKLQGLGTDVVISQTGAVDLTTSTCVTANGVIDAINANKGSGTLYVRLDEIANANENAEFKGGQAAQVKGQALKTLIWVQNGRINDPDVEELDQHNGKTLYLLTVTKTYRVGYPFRGIQLCSDINPERDFPWWGGG